MRYIVVNFFIFSSFCHLVTGQTGELRSVEEVIRGIDELLGEYDQGFEAMETAPVNTPVMPQRSIPSSVQPSQTTPENYFDPAGLPQPDPLPSMEGSYRLDNELLPEILRKPTIDPSPIEDVSTQQEPISLPKENSVGEDADIIPPIGETVDTKISLLPNIDYKNANLEDLLREVDSLELPEFESPIVLPPASLSQDQKVKPLPSARPTEDKLVRSSKLNKGSPEVGQPNQGENYIVLGERIDQELREKIREAIMSTRLASGGTGNPFVTRSVFKAESNCNKVLGRLNAPFHKRYRRDILLSLIRMHERNKQWVNAA